MKRRILAITIAAMLAMTTLAACGSNGSGSTDSSTDASEERSEENTTEAVEGDATSSDDPVKLLAYACITGNNAESGRQVTMAAETAEWYINEKLGGFPSLGGRKVQIEVLDSTSDAATATLPLERALSNGGYACVIGNSTSSIALTMLPILEKYEVAAITGAAANRAVSEQGASFVFQPSDRKSVV